MKNKTKPINDLSQLASLKEKMEFEDQQYYVAVREKRQYLGLEEDDMSGHYDPTAFAIDTRN